MAYSIIQIIYILQVNTLPVIYKSQYYSTNNWLIFQLNEVTAVKLGTGGSQHGASKMGENGELLFCSGDLNYGHGDHLLDQQMVWYLNNNLNVGPVFESPFKYQTKFRLVIK